jgi:hypothetical protein
MHNREKGAKSAPITKPYTRWNMGRRSKVEKNNKTTTRRFALEERMDRQSSVFRTIKYGLKMQNKSYFTTKAFSGRIPRNTTQARVVFLAPKKEVNAALHRPTRSCWKKRQIKPFEIELTMLAKLATCYLC